MSSEICVGWLSTYSEAFSLSWLLGARDTLHKAPTCDLARMRNQGSSAIVHLVKLMSSA